MSEATRSTGRGRGLAWRVLGRWRCLALGFVLGFTLSLGSPDLAGAQDETEPPGSHPVLGYHEAVWSVGDLGVWIETLEAVAGWEVVSRGPADPRLAEIWRLDAETRLDRAVLRNPGSERGWIRLIQVPGARPPMARPHAQSWDTGGHFDVNLRALDLDTRMDELERRGFTAYSEPLGFTFGPFEVREVLARGPDGIVLAMIERLAPPLEGWPHLRRLSRLFNATQVVADFDRALHFYRDILGFRIYLEHEGPSREEGPNVLGLPHDLTARVPRKVAILSPDGGNDGSIEILSFEGIRGADFSARAEPPNRGIVSLRFPVRGLDVWLARLASHDVELWRPVSELDLGDPWGTVRIAAIRTPEGAWLEFFEPVGSSDGTMHGGGEDP